MAKLTIIEGADAGSEFQVPPEAGAVLTLGRDPRNSAPLSDASVSREHLRVEFDGRDFRLVDLGSKNRTFLNGEPVRESILRNGDRIGLGDTEVRFEEDRPAAEEDGARSTIIKELPATGAVAIQSILESLGAPAGSAPELSDERSERASSALRNLMGLSRALAGCRSVEELHRELLRIVVPALGASQGAVLALSGGAWVPREMLEGEAARGKQGAAGAPAPGLVLSHSIVARVAEEGKAILSSHTGSDARFQDRESIIQGAITSAVAAPILAPAHGSEGAPPAAGGARSRGVSAVLYADRRSGLPPFGEAELGLLLAAADQAGDVLAHLGEEARLREENRTLLRSLSQKGKIVGRSKSVSALLEFIRRAALSEGTVLIRGETGTGKELVASAIHYASPRQGKPFMALNCAAIQETLIESELFGHERGAFTGALARRKGRFEMAQGGTVFLDEIAEMPVSSQAKLLRLLEDRRFERVGGTETIEAKVRIIAATNRDLSEAIRTGKFREDLFYRLNVLGITLAPLRERKEDLPILAAHFLESLGSGNRQLAPGAEAKLLAYSWPGNIRQLRNVIESAVVLGDGPQIRAEDLVLPPERSFDPLAAAGTTLPAGTQGSLAGRMSTVSALSGASVSASGAWEPIPLEEIEKRHIIKVLEHTGGNKKRAADLLGIERCTLYAKLKSIQKDEASGRKTEPAAARPRASRADDGVEVDP